MKIKTFKYRKKNNKEDEYKVLILQRTTKDIFGLDLNKLNEEEIEKVKKIQKKYEDEIAPFVKISYRHFLNESIIENLKEEVL